MTKRIIVTLIASVMALSACQKKDTTPMQPDKITINLSYPKDGQVYHNGDTVNMQAAIAYVSELHGYELSIKRKDNNEVVFDTYEHVHTDKFDINTQWIDSLSAPVELKLELTVQIDHDGNQSTKEITLYNQL